MVKFKEVTVQSFLGRRHAYSNLGYTILGQVIARVSGQSYEAFMLNLLKTVEIERMRIGRTRKEELQPDEVSTEVKCTRL